ncbi:hypothetical protein ACOSQ4_001051 [Xanthoceras sorbifolium]
MGAGTTPISRVRSRSLQVKQRPRHVRHVFHILTSVDLSPSLIHYTHPHAHKAHASFVPNPNFAHTYTFESLDTRETLGFTRTSAASFPSGLHRLCPRRKAPNSVSSPYLISYGAPAACRQIRRRYFG